MSETNFPIYLTETERDLAVRAIRFVKQRCVNRINVYDGVELFALEWTRDELDPLLAKFMPPEEEG